MPEGDAFFVAFASPTAAVRAAVDGQRALQREAWPAGSRVLVRMGLHTGEAVVAADTYVGLDVHRGSRVASAGHGGQLLISDATRALVEHALPEGATIHDLGFHRLKGLPSAERIYQVTIDGLPARFAPLNSLEVRRHNLPPQGTSFIGREQQILEVKERLSSARLLTLTGPGGTGKTRLAIRVAEEVIAEFEHGCWFVPLHALRDPDLVPSTIAGSLGVQIAGDRPVISALEDWLSQRELLLVLDNFEQVGRAAPSVARLLAAAPRLRVLATSRTPLHLSGEYEYPVPPLATGGALDSAAAPTAESLSQFEAVQLFIERALAVKPDFRVTNANAPAVAEICARLDGLPLPIELAAARVKLLSPEQMLPRLEQSLSLLVSAAQDLPERQRTVCGAIQWSYELLGEPEQRLFACLSIFRGGFTLEAVEQVCGGDDLGVHPLDGVATLLDNSLLRTEEAATEVRFSMLETIRGYAREMLDQSGRFETLVRRHATYFFALAAHAETHLTGSQQRDWLARLGREHDNLRAAFARGADIDLLDDALRAAGAIWRFWQLRGLFEEAGETFDRLLAQTGGAAGARAKALLGAGGIAYWRGDFDAMARDYAEARELYESIGDLAGTADALYNESYVPLLLRGDIDTTRSRLEHALALYRRADNPLGAAEAESFLGFTHYFQGEPEAAIPYQERAVEALRTARASWQLSENLLGLGGLYAQTGDWPRAVVLVRESLAIANEMGIDIGIAMTLEWVGASASWIGDVERSARLFGKADEMKERLGASAPRLMVQTGDQRATAREALGNERYQELLAQGAGLSSLEAIQLAVQFEPPPDAPPLPRAKLLGAEASGVESSSARTTASAHDRQRDGGAHDA